MPMSRRAHMRRRGTEPHLSGRHHQPQRAPGGTWMGEHEGRSCDEYRVGVRKQESARSRRDIRH